LATQALEETHKLILALRPIALDELGLVAAVRSDAEARLQPRGINVQVRVTGARRRIAPQLELTLFRIAQEAINNIAKHAQAQHVGIMFEFRDAAVHVLIQDDGQGFDPAAPRAADPTRGLGLLGMAERAQHAGGTLQIDSQAGRGTRIAIAMPTPAEVG
jgi:signal transduction histidine kinase